ncbi:hypothetical protein J7K18_04660 [bacterium]|nr:hypothetical protein [bacterium]
MGSSVRFERRYGFVSLFSGGLDSILATRLMSEAGYSILAVKMLLPFYPGRFSREVKRYFHEAAGCEVVELPVGEDYLELVRSPSFGYGKNANPCLDCRLYLYRKGWEVAKLVGARGIITGEVVGQRPFSQRRDALIFLDKRSGIQGRILRPLTAKNLPETELEKSGFVKRETLLDIRGRGRARQFELAKKFGIKEFISPAGGCLLTDPGFARRVFALIESGNLHFPATDIVKFGRMFKINNVILSVARDKTESDELDSIYSLENVENIGHIECLRCAGPSAVFLAPSEVSEEMLELLSSMVVRFSPKLGGRGEVLLSIGGRDKIISAVAADDATIERYRV